MPVGVDREERQRTAVGAAVEQNVVGGLEVVSFRNLTRHLGSSKIWISPRLTDDSGVLSATYHYDGTQTAKRRDDSYARQREPVTALKAIRPIGDDQRCD